MHPDQPPTARVTTAGLIVIGDEILSGRTEDRNIAEIARFLGELGIDLDEVRVVPDRLPAIVTAVNALRGIHDEVFTTGGIGPTHDDLTADAIALAVGTDIEESEDALAMLVDRYGQPALSPSRRRMARIPVGATLIPNPISAAPGFTIGNVHVLAGVPEIARAMLRELAPRLTRGEQVGVRSLMVPMGEGAFAAPLGDLQRHYPEVAIGSYPKITAEGFRVEIVLRSRNMSHLADAATAVEQMIADLDAMEDPDGPARP